MGSAEHPSKMRASAILLLTLGLLAVTPFTAAYWDGVNDMPPSGRHDVDSDGMVSRTLWMTMMTMTAFWMTTIMTMLILCEHIFVYDRSSSCIICNNHLCHKDARQKFPHQLRARRTRPSHWPDSHSHS